MRLSDVWVWVVSVFGVLLLGHILFNFILVEEVSGPECVDVNRAAGFLYDVCYDSLTGNILMLVEGDMLYEFDRFGVVFYDGSSRVYDLIYEDVDSSQLYKFGASMNPGKINLTIEVAEDLGLPVCEEPRVVPVKDCQTKNPGWGKGSINGTVIEYTGEEIAPAYENVSEIDFDIRDNIWRSFCESDWECGAWEECMDGYQYRNCVDLNGCYAAVDVPNTVQVCGDVCEESWVCEWSDCVDGLTIPNCYDENDCGTEYIFPPSVVCSFGGGCIPNIVCEDWSSCDIDYDFLDLAGEGVSGLGGVRTRVCRDTMGCVESVVDVKNCSVGLDIYTEKFAECGEQYLGVYDSNSGDLVARVGGGDGDVFNVYLDSGERVICEHCYNEVQDMDESGVDCGGSCGECYESYSAVHVKNDWWDEFLDLFG